MIFRTGVGYDVHPLIHGRDLIIGGIHVPSETGESAHSDGDVLIHAIVDALLGSIAAGDIGTYFPDTDPAYRNVPSRNFLEKTVSILQQQGYSIVNIDATIILEKPKIKPYIVPIRQHLAGIMQVPEDTVSVKATTHEKLGPVGEGKAIACIATAMVAKETSHE